MSGQYVMCWTADFDDQPPSAGPGAVAKYMALAPSVTRNISQNARITVNCATTQKWYYVRANEDKDCEFGRIWVAVISPMANVTSGSSTSMVLRCRWTYEFQMPELPMTANPDQGFIYASAPNYFTDSSSDWKEGKFLTFKWHEGGDIVGFPGAVAWKVYKLVGSSYAYYQTNGTVATSAYAVAVGNAETESGQPLLACVKGLAEAKAYAKDHTDTSLLAYYSAGDWIHPENPAWQQVVEVDLDLSVRSTFRALLPPSAATLRVADSSVAKTNAVIATASSNTAKRLLELASNIPNDRLNDALTALTRLSFQTVPVEGEALVTFNTDPLRNSTHSESSDSSIEVINSPRDVILG